MKHFLGSTLKPVGIAIAMTLGVASAAPAFAQHFHGPRVHFGFGFGGPVYWGAPYYPYPYPPAYYYPPAVMAPAQPTYIERSDAAPSAPPSAQDYWYYCGDAKAYYPYVKECPGGWQRVTPRTG